MYINNCKWTFFMSNIRVTVWLKIPIIENSKDKGVIRVRNIPVIS